MGNLAAPFLFIKELKLQGFIFVVFIYLETIFAVILHAIWNSYLLRYSFLAMLL
jgi:hypothetical protein